MHIAVQRGNEVYPIVWSTLFRPVIVKAFYPLLLGVFISPLQYVNSHLVQHIFSANKY